VENHENNSRESGLSKVIARNPEEEKNITAFFKRTMENQTSLPFEREKTESQTGVIEEILKYLPEFIKQYRGVPVMFSADNVHVIDPEKMSAEEKEKFKYMLRGAGTYDANDQKLISQYQPGDEKKNLKFAYSILHEIMHLESFQSYQQIKSHAITDRRLGISMVSYKDGKSYFLDINEAVTEELSKRFAEKYFGKMEVLQPELDKKDSWKRHLKPHAKHRGENLRYVEDVEGKSPTFFYHTYKDEREQLNELIADLYEKHKGRFESPEKVFDLFARACMTGKVLELARLIEDTYGKGAFRDLAEKTKQK